MCGLHGGTSVLSPIIGIDGSVKFIINFWIIASMLERTNYNTLRYLSLTIRIQQQTRSRLTYSLIFNNINKFYLLILATLTSHPIILGGGGCGGEHLIATPLGLVVMCTGMATVRRLNGTDISVTDSGDVTMVGGEDTGVICDSHWRDA